MHTTLLEVATTTNSDCFNGHCGPYDTQGAVTWETMCWGWGGGGGGAHSLWTIPAGCGYCCFWPYSVTGRGYSDLQGRLHSAPQWGLTERRNHSNGTTTQQGVDFHSLITKKCIAKAQSSYTTTGVRLYLFICYHGNKAAWQRCHIKDINCRNNVTKRWDLLNIAPVVRVERSWPSSHRLVRILPLICSVQMPPKCRASAGVAQAILAASGPAFPDPTPPMSEAVIDNIADRILARIEELLPRHSHLHLQQYYPTWQPGHHWGLQSRTQWSVHPWQVSYHQPRGHRASWHTT